MLLHQTVLLPRTAWAKQKSSLVCSYRRAISLVCRRLLWRKRLAKLRVADDAAGIGVLIVVEWHEHLQNRKGQLECLQCSESVGCADALLSVC